MRLFPGAQRYIEREQKRARLAVLMERHGRNCAHCGRRVRIVRPKTGVLPKDAATEDHIVLKCEGGSDHTDNLLLSCHGCNNDRGNMPLAVFQERRARLERRT